MRSRRAFLATAISSSFTAGGCLGKSSEFVFVKGSQLTTSEPLFSQSNWLGKPIKAELFTRADELTKALNTGAFPQNSYDEYLHFDTEEYFLSVFSSRLKLSDSGESKGWCPSSEVNDNRFLFNVPLHEWPKEFNDTNRRWVRLEMWRKNGNDIPTDVRTNIILTDEEDESINSCSS